MRGRSPAEEGRNFCGDVGKLIGAGGTLSCLLFDMSNNKEDKTQAAAALLAAKGMSRAQAERAAAAQARNVNAYGQKEEGPSRWQERKEAKRQMYLMSTEKAVKLGERKDQKASVSSSGGAAAQCQKCFQFGHWTYECKNERVYMSRPSRTQQLKNPKLKMKLTVSYELDKPDIANQEKYKRSQKKEKSEPSGAKSKRKHRSPSDSDEDSSEASVFNTDSETTVTGTDYSSAESSSSYSSSDSEEKRRRQQKRRKQKKRRHRRVSSSSNSSASDSISDSDSYDGGSQRKSKRHSRRH